MVPIDDFNNLEYQYFCIFNFRGLDVQPKTLAKFASQKDVKSVDVLKVIYTDEITHVAAGLRWFTYVCQHHHPPLVNVSLCIYSVCMRNKRGGQYHYNFIFSKTK